MSEKCGKKNRAGGKCAKPAGWGTDHVGVGPCKLHGGATPVKHGRYSAIKRQSLGTLIAQYEADPEPLNLLPELATARALFRDYLDRNEGKGDVDTSGATAHLEAIARIVKRIEDIRAQDAISRPELIRVMAEMGRNAEHRIAQLGRRMEEMLPPEKLSHLEDLMNDMREGLQDDWNRIRIA